MTSATRGLRSTTDTASEGRQAGGLTTHGTPTEPPTAPPGDEHLGQTLKVASDHRRSLRIGRLRKFGLSLGVLVVFLAVWWLVTALEWVRPLYLPSPGSVWTAFVEANGCTEVSPTRTVCGEQNYYMWEHLIASLQRIGVGVGVAVVLGPVVGFLMASIGWVNTAFEPYLNFLRSLPPLGYIGLLIVWFGIGDLSKYWLLFLAAFPPIVIATINGVRGVRQDSIHAAQSMGASRWQVGTSVVLPSTLPEVIGGVRIAVGFAWTTVVAAELNAGIPGIGGLAYVSGQQLQTALTIACIIVIGLAAVALDALIKYLGSLAVPWYGKA
ncbi:taurine transport system permease protein [Ornithinicoccus hortensis]|uniref:Taurine transport system permease protein n=1 Tax=Ornithinicoccus hortensis TaxID=82346 RepID=A0A542YLN4_9MICO|nr:taurine transport system permease protein [Ornithinicoccus hortensis]